MKRFLRGLFLLGVTIAVPANAMSSGNPGQWPVDMKFLKPLVGQIATFTVITAVSGVMYLVV